MSHSNGIRRLLDIQDPNIIFKENCVLEGEFKGKTCKCVDAKLTYHLTHCKICGVKTKIIRFVTSASAVHQK